jgi:hypothetical protein
MTEKKYSDIKTNQSSGDIVIFGNAAHLTAMKHGCNRQNAIHCPRTDRFNAYSGCYATRHSLSMDEHCNSVQMISFLQTVVDKYPTAPKIKLFLNNGVDFEQEIVAQWLIDYPQLEVKFLPPNSAKLSWIESFWRLTKGKFNC